MENTRIWSQGKWVWCYTRKPVFPLGPHPQGSSCRARAACKQGPHLHACVRPPDATHLHVGAVGGARSLRRMQQLQQLWQRLHCQAQTWMAQKQRRLLRGRGPQGQPQQSDRLAWQACMGWLSVMPAPDVRRLGACLLISCRPAPVLGTLPFAVHPTTVSGDARAVKTLMTNVS